MYLLKHFSVLLLTVLFINSGAVKAQRPHFIASYRVDSCVNYYAYELVDSMPGYLGQVETSYGDGTMDSTYIVYSVIFGPTYVVGDGTVQHHQYASSGTYTMKNVLLYNGHRYDSISNTINVGCMMAMGLIYPDINANCSLDINESFNGSYSYFVDSAGTRIDTFQTFNEFWEYPVHGPVGTVFTIIPNPATYPTGYQVACPSSGVQSIVTPSSSGIGGYYNFGLQIVPTGVHSAGQISAPDIFPNPVMDLLQLRNFGAGPKDIQIKNSIGQLQVQKRLASSESQLDVSQLPPGMYYLQVSATSGITTFRIVKK